MPLDMKGAASKLIDAGYSDDDIRAVLGAVKGEASKLMDSGLSDAEIEKKVATTKFRDKTGKDILLFATQAPVSISRPTAPIATTSDIYANPEGYTKPTLIPRKPMFDAGQIIKESAIPAALGFGAAAATSGLGLPAVM